MRRQQRLILLGKMSSALALSDKAFKKFMDAWKLYEPALYDREVFKHLDAVVAKAKKT